MCGAVWECGVWGSRGWGSPGKVWGCRQATQTGSWAMGLVLEEPGPTALSHEAGGSQAQTKGVAWGTGVAQKWGWGLPMPWEGG